MNFTPENISKLKDNEIFVFGSNLNGEHLGGAARIAYKQFGAIYGQAIGLQGNSYALPTLDKDYNKLSHDELIKHINNLRITVLNNPNLTFFITKIGCGIANFSIDEIKPLFASFKTLDNVILPREFV